MWIVDIWVEVMLKDWVVCRWGGMPLLILLMYCWYGKSNTSYNACGVLSFFLVLCKMGIRKPNGLEDL